MDVTIGRIDDDCADRLFAGIGNRLAQETRVNVFQIDFRNRNPIILDLTIGTRENVTKRRRGGRGNLPGRGTSGEAKRRSGQKEAASQSKLVGGFHPRNTLG